MADRCFYFYNYYFLLQAKEGRWTKTSHYCPIDLYSGWVDSRLWPMARAIKCHYCLVIMISVHNRITLDQDSRALYWHHTPKLLFPQVIKNLNITLLWSRIKRFCFKLWCMLFLISSKICCRCVHQDAFLHLIKKLVHSVQTVGSK